MKKLLLVCCILSVIAFVGCAGEAEARGNPCDSKFLGPILNECSPHTVDTDTDTWRDEWDDEAGIGADILIHETKQVDLVAEYKVDFNNDNHQSVYGVIRTKTSLVELVKKGLKKLKREKVE